jgi:hypothetical protein
MIFLLELGEFQPGIKATTTSMLTSVKILSLTVRFGVRNDVKMLPTLLRCFPKLDRLHIMVRICCHQFMISLHFYEFLFDA